MLEVKKEGIFTIIHGVEHEIILKDDECLIGVYPNYRIVKVTDLDWECKRFDYGKQEEEKFKEQD